MDRGLWNLSMVVDNSLSAVSTVSAHLGGYVPVITKTQAGLYGGLSVPSGGPAWSREWMRLGLHCLVPRSVEIDCMKALHSPFDLVPDALIEGYMVPVKVDPRSATVIGFREDTMTVAVGCCAVVPRALKLGLLERSAQAYAAVREAGGVVYGIGYVDETAGVGFHVPPAL
jgi:hypothetical protein